MIRRTIQENTLAIVRKTSLRLVAILFMASAVLLFFGVRHYEFVRSHRSLETVSKNLSLVINEGDRLQIERLSDSILSANKVISFAITDCEGSPIVERNTSGENIGLFGRLEVALGSSMEYVITDSNGSCIAQTALSTLFNFGLYSSLIGLMLFTIVICYQILKRTIISAANSITRPIYLLPSAVENATPPSEAAPEEIHWLYNRLVESRKNELEVGRLKMEKIASETLNKLSLQVAHDIRSPVTALRTIASLLGHDNDEHKRLLLMATERVQKIADDLLGAVREDNHSAVDLNEVTSRIVQEKLLVNSGAKDIEFLADKELSKIKANSSDLERVISNIINNALEACSRKIQITTKVDDAFNYLTVEDDGKGFEEGVLDKVGHKQISNKLNGNGLGLFDAHQKAKSWGSQIHLGRSSLGGASVCLAFPKAI